ncbi:MAG: hypothetical protein HDS62_08420 [Bacteroidales bacterium]|nr:hypothetical protein [Bacteroidales bacterium]
MSYTEFSALRKLANKARKHVTEIGKCNEYETHLEALELQALRETSTELFAIATAIYYKYN